MTDNRPDLGAGSSSYNPLDAWADSEETSQLWRSVQNFYDATRASYDQISSIMRGEGGDSLEEAAERLNELTDCSVRSFGLATECIIKEYSDDTDAAAETITNLFINDDHDRVKLFRELNKEVDYAETDHDDVKEGFVYLLSQDMEATERQETMQELYFRTIGMDVGKCLSQGSPPNTSEQARQKQQERHDKIKHVAQDVAKMAGSAILAVAIVRLTGK